MFDNIRQKYFSVLTKVVGGVKYPYEVRGGVCRCSLTSNLKERFMKMKRVCL